jgi:hypothetical protein
LTEREGVTRYVLDHRPGGTASRSELAMLDAWRSVLHRLGLIGGGDPGRYDGLGFGNVSCRVPRCGFLISGTQTGHLPELGAAGYSHVLYCDTAANHVTATGPVAPSSESLSHGAVYAARPRANCVMHVHSPEIWHTAGPLRLPATAAQVPYGTPAMADEMVRLCHAMPAADRGVFIMAGHEDGVIAFGPDETVAGELLTAALVRALVAAAADQGVGSEIRRN